MKSKTLPFLLATLFLANSANSATFTWDIAPGTVGVGDSAITGGSGTWDLASGNWTTDAGVNNVVWGNTNADEAIFGNVAGTVTINTGSGVTANRLTFNSGGYTINGSVAADVLTLAGTTPTITVTSSGHTAIIGATVTGSDGLTKSGAGALVLPTTTSLTYSGSTTVADGALTVTLALPSSNLVLNGGVFSPGTSFSRTLGTGTSNVQFTGSGGFWANGSDKTARFGSSNNTLMTWASTQYFLGDGHTFLLSHETSNAKITFLQPISFNGAARTVEVRNGSAAVDAEFSNVLQGTGSSGIVKTGAGNLALSAANSFEGTTTISDGSLRIGTGGTTGRLTATTAIINNANLTINRSDAFTQAADLGAGVSITGTGSFTQTGTGTTSLTVENTYSGITYIDAGALRITHGGALGTTGNNTRIDSDAKLELAGDITSNEPLATNGAGSAAAADRIVNVSGTNTLGGTLTNGTGGNHYGIRSDSGLLTLSGNITFPNSSSRTLYLRGAGDGLISGNILAGTSNIVPIIKEGTGIWTLSGTNTYNGDTTVSAGALTLSGADSAANANTGNDASTVTIAATGATLNLNYTGTDNVNKLFIGTTQQAAGTYGHTNSGATNGGLGVGALDAYFGNGSGTLTVATGPGFSNWITGSGFANGSVPGGQQGANDDPDNDGISNLVEYAVAGLDPTVANAAIGTFSGLTLTFTKRTPLATDISYVIETSPNLQNPWTAQVTHGLGNTDPTISYTLPSGGGNLFARLKVQN